MSATQLKNNGSAWRRTNGVIITRGGSFTPTETEMRTFEAARYIGSRFTVVDQAPALPPESEEVRYMGEQAPAPVGEPDTDIGSAAAQAEPEREVEPEPAPEPEIQVHVDVVGDPESVREAFRAVVSENGERPNKRVKRRHRR